MPYRYQKKYDIPLAKGQDQRQATPGASGILVFAIVCNEMLTLVMLLYKLNVIMCWMQYCVVVLLRKLHCCS